MDTGGWLQLYPTDDAGYHRLDTLLQPASPHTFNGGLSPCEYENQWKEAMQVS